MATSKKKKVNKKATKAKSLKKKTSKKKIKKPITHIALVVDKSGSMDIIRSETINHFNEQLEKIVEDSKDMDTRVTLTTFNHKVSIDVFDEPVDKIKPLTLDTYVPDGMTAEYDAIGDTIAKMEAEIKDIKKKDVAVLFVVLSDGHNNSSVKYTETDIAEKVQKLQATKRWTFSYLGANKDISVVAKKLNIPIGNTSSFVPNSAGMIHATGMSVNSTSNYLRSRRMGKTSSKSYYSDSGEESTK